MINRLTSWIADISSENTATGILWSTAAFPEPTYFNTAARAFELAAGALLACVMSSPLSSRA